MVGYCLELLRRCQAFIFIFIFIVKWLPLRLVGFPKYKYKRKTFLTETSLISLSCLWSVQSHLHIIICCRVASSRNPQQMAVGLVVRRIVVRIGHINSTLNFGEYSYSIYIYIYIYFVHIYKMCVFFSFLFVSRREQA